MKKMMVGIGISVAIALLLSIGVVGVTVADKLDGYTHDGTKDFEEYCLNAIQACNKMIPQIETACSMRDKELSYRLCVELIDKIGRPNMGRGNPYIEDNVYDAYAEISSARSTLCLVPSSLDYNEMKERDWENTARKLQKAKELVKNAEELLGKSSLKIPGVQTPMVSVVGVILAMMVAIGVSKKKKKRS